jgi:hypothetical protein
MERRFGRKDKVKERSYRFLAYLPVDLLDQTGEQSYAVIKDISNTGLLLASRKSWPAGSKLDIGIVLGNERVALLGVVVRDFTHDSEDFREYLFGIQLIEADQEKVRRILSIAEKSGHLFWNEIRQLTNKGLLFIIFLYGAGAMLWNLDYTLYTTMRRLIFSWSKLS